MTNKSSKVISCLDDTRDTKERLFKGGKRKFPWSYEQINFEREKDFCYSSFTLFKN